MERRLHSNVVSCRKFRLPYHLTPYHKYERKVKTYGETDAECEIDNGERRYHGCTGKDNHGELYPEIDCGHDLASGESHAVGGTCMIYWIAFAVIVIICGTDWVRMYL